MKSTYSYAAVLKKLMSLADVKMLIVAKTVGYDISYISKWCSGSNLPPTKIKDAINHDLANLFTDGISAKKAVHKFNEEFQIDMEEPYSKDAVLKAINALLSASYNNSAMNVPGKAAKQKNDGANFVAGHPTALNYVLRTLRTIIEESAHDLEIISTVDLCNFLNQISDGELNQIRLKDIQVNFKTFVNMETFRSAPDHNIKQIYRYLNSMLNFNIWIYEQNEQCRYNVLAVKNHIAFIFAIDANGHLQFAAETRERNTVNNIYEQSRRVIERENIALRPETHDSLMKDGYRTKFYSGSDFCFYCAFGFEFLMPADVAGTIAEQALAYTGDPHMADYIKKLQITWEERLINDNEHIEFIIPKSNVIRYAEQGKIYYADIPFTLTVEQRQRHFRHIISIMRKNPNMKIRILDDGGEGPSAQKHNISVYYNQRKMFLKKNGYVIETPNAKRYSSVISSGFLDYFDVFFNNLCQEPLCKSYDADEIEEIVNKYENMFLRMLNL